MSADPRQTLYISDLDGTLLRSDGSLSLYSVRDRSPPNCRARGLTNL